MKIITMVGTSMFENYLKGHSNFANSYRYFKENNLPAEKMDAENGRINILKNAFKENKWCNERNINASAEIKSLIKLKEKLRDKFKIHLLYFDTLLSGLAAQILKENLPNYSQLKVSSDDILG